MELQVENGECISTERYCHLKYLKCNAQTPEAAETLVKTSPGTQ